MAIYFTILLRYPCNILSVFILIVLLCDNSNSNRWYSDHQRRKQKMTPIFRRTRTAPSDSCRRRKRNTCLRIVYYCLCMCLVKSQSSSRPDQKPRDQLFCGLKYHLSFPIIVFFFWNIFISIILFYYSYL